MLGTCTLNLARSASLREAADVLRTDRRTEKGEGATLVNAKGGLLLQQSIRRHAQEYVYGAKCR